MTAEKNRQFLEQVVVWPGAQEAPGWVNLHTHMKNPDPAKNGGKPWVLGWPFKTINDFTNRALWIDNTDMFFDVWFCTSTQREMKTSKKTGKPQAVRLARNATWLKSIWIDVDVKVRPANHPAGTPWKHYETIGEALAAVDAFCRKVGLPVPSALVHSGGGLHVYWISDAPLSPDDWRPYAEGLKALLIQEGVKCDTGLTTDSARILRVPGTLNHKYTPPRPVKLLHFGSLFNFGTSLSFLKNVFISTDLSVADSNISVMEPGDWSAPDAAFAGLNAADNSVAAGIEQSSGTSGPLDPAPIFEQCGFMSHALSTGGADYDNPLWNLSVLCTVFMEKGDVLAHEVSKGHPTYSAADTQALYDRKVADRADRGIGYPSCSTIAGAGCKSCASCPLLAKGKSPLNIRPQRTPPAVTATVTRTNQTAAAQALSLPDRYDIDADNNICYIDEKITRDGDVQEKWLKLFHCEIDMAWAQKDPDVLHLHVSTDKGNWNWAALKVEDFCGQGFEKKLAQQKIKYFPENKARLEGFFMAFLSKMHKAAAAQQALGFGWYRPVADIAGFAFGGFIFHEDGSASPAGLSDRLLQQRFAPKGQTAPWYKAMSYITRQKRPELETCVAIAFAAPLLEMTGVTGAMLSVAGDRGAGKTYALEVGCAVWGHPKLTKEGETSTPKSVLNRLGHTSNLPAYWDEVSEEPIQARILSLLNNTTGGVEGSRINAAINQQDRGTWSTILCINANKKFREFVITKQRDHGAALSRVMEYWTTRDVPNPVGQVPTSESDQALGALRHNFGNVGLEYAKLLATKHKQIQKIINTNLADLEAKLRPNKEDRMWLGLTAALITGAQVANLLSTPVGFDVQMIYDFLLSTYADNRAYRSSANVDPNATDYGEDYLAQYLKDRTNETIITEGSPSGPGRQPKVSWRRLFPNANASHGIQVRWDSVDNTLRFSRKNFEEWCASREGRIVSTIIDSLKKTYGLFCEKRSLCAGTPFKVTQEWVYTISVVGHQDLIDIMNSQGPNQDLGAVVGMDPVDTGITTAEAS